MTDEPKNPAWKTTQQTLENARRLRLDMTDAERVIWNAIRAHRMHRIGFRRQKPIGPYIVDFVSDAVKLIIEIDGGQHYQAKGIESDSRRDSFLASKGFRVLRFSNHDVLSNRTGVLETIASALALNAPTPTLPRKRERGQVSHVETSNSTFGKPKP